MSRFPCDDDFFSPVQVDTSAVDENSDDSSEESSNVLSITDELSFTGAVKDKVVKVNRMELTHKNVFDPNDKIIINPESVDMVTPISNRNSSNKLNEKKHSSKLKLEKFNNLNSAFMEERNDESYQKMKETSELLQKKAKSTCSLSKSKNSKQASLKDVKRRQKDDQSSLDKISTKNVTNLESKSSIKLKDSSAKSTDPKKSTSTNSNDGSSQMKELTVNPLTSYEVSIEQRVRRIISSETDKIRQLMYMQQMSFYREINKLKDEMERKHLVMTAHLLKVTGSLSQMNASLEIALSNKN